MSRTPHNEFERWFAQTPRLKFVDTYRVRTDDLLAASEAFYQTELMAHNNGHTHFDCVTFDREADALPLS